MTVQAQDDYPMTLTRSVPGQCDGINPMFLKARTAEGSSIPFGRVVQAGSTNSQLKLGTGAGTGRILGVSVINLAREAAIGADSVEYADGADVTYTTNGPVNVKVNGDFTEGGAVYADDTTGEIYAASAAGRTQVPGWEFDTSGLDGEIGLIQRP